MDKSHEFTSFLQSNRLPFAVYVTKPTEVHIVKYVRLNIEFITHKHTCTLFSLLKEWTLGLAGENLSYSLPFSR